LTRSAGPTAKRLRIEAKISNAALFLIDGARRLDLD